MTIQESKLINKYVTSLYAKFGITEDNSSIYKEDKTIKTMPIITDFIKEIEQDEMMERICILFIPFTEGNFQNMNGQTNVDFSNKCIAFDVDSKQMEEEMLAPMLFLAVDICYDIMKRDRTENNILFLDEVWKLTVNEHAAALVDELYKIVRGYGAGVWSATQEIDNLRRVSNGEFSKAILNNSETKIVLKAKEIEAPQIKEFLGLNDSEEKQITKMSKGHGLLIANQDHIPIHLVSTEDEIDAFTTEASRLREISNRRKMEKR